MTTILSALENEFPTFVDIIKRVNELDNKNKESIREKDKEIKVLNEKIEDLERDIENKDEEIEDLERDVKSTNDIPDRLLQNDLDTIGKIELFAEYIDKYNYFQLKERLA